MKLCKKCGRQMNDDSRFCPYCDWDSMPSMSGSSADVSQDGGFFSRRSKKSDSHSANGHNCRAESVNGRETVRQKPAGKTKWKPVETKTVSRKKGGLSVIKLVVIMFVLFTFGIPFISFIISSVNSDYIETDNDNGYFSFDFSSEESAEYSAPFDFGRYSEEDFWYENESADLTFYSDLSEFSYFDLDEFAAENALPIDNANGKPYSIKGGITDYYDAVFRTADGQDSIAFILSYGDFSETDIEAYVLSRAGADSEVYYMEIGGLTYACVDVYDSPRCRTVCCAKGDNTVFTVELSISSDTDTGDLLYDCFSDY